MDYRIFSDKEMEKQEKDMVELHKRCVKNYLVQRSLKHGKIKKFFIIYDYYLGTENIRNYFFRPIDMFVRFLLLGKLEEIEDYVKADSRKKKRKHKRNKSMVSSESKTIRRKMVEINKTSKVLFSGPVSSMVACWRNALLLVRRSYRISKESRISLRNLQHNTRDINAVNDLELGQGVKFIIIELCFEK